MKILPVIYGKSEIPESMAFLNGDENKFREILFKVYVIKTENKIRGCKKSPDRKERFFNCGMREGTETLPYKLSYSR